MPSKSIVLNRCIGRYTFLRDNRNLRLFCQYLPYEDGPGEASHKDRFKD